MTGSSKDIFPKKLQSFDTVEEDLKFSVLFGRIYVILCILNSRGTVKIDDFRAYCLKTHIRWNKPDAGVMAHKLKNRFSKEQIGIFVV